MQKKHKMQDEGKYVLHQKKKKAVVKMFFF